MRWLYHLTVDGADLARACAPASLASEGFVHASYRDEVAESARLYFRDARDVSVLQVDPRRLDAPVDLADTPRGVMPHVRGAIPVDAVRRVWTLPEFAGAPDAVTGTRVGFVAFAGMTLLDLVGALDPISRIAAMGFDPTTTCEVVAAHDAATWSGHGATFTVARYRPDLREFDVLVLPGGTGTRAMVTDAALLAWLATWPANRLVATVCTGSLLLGAVGRLEGRRATTHHGEYEALAGYGATVSRERVVDEGQVVTAGGVTSAIDLGLHVVRRLMGPEVEWKVAAQMAWTTGRAVGGPEG